MTTPLALEFIDLIRVHPCPLAVGAAAPVVPLHSHPPLCPKEGISSWRLTRRSRPAVPSAHPIGW